MPCLTDVAIVGGGPAGCAVAAGLARRGIRTSVIAGTSRTRWPGESLPPGSDRIVAPVFGAGPLANPIHRVAYGNRSAWNSDELVASDFLFNPLGHGWHLDRQVFDGDLRAAAIALGAHIVTGSNVMTIERTGHTWHVTLADRTVVQSRFLVDASGRSSTVARRQGSTRVRLDHQVALVGVFVTTEDDADSTTVVEAAEDGWWYSSPLPGGTRVVAFLTDSDLLSAARKSIAGWRDALRRTTHVSALIDGCSCPAKLIASSAETSYLSELSGPGWLAVGDAAMAWDPLSSQGIATAILMGDRGADVIVEDLHHRGEALHEWLAAYRELLRSHCEERRDLACAVRRWPDAPFWVRRRRATGTTGLRRSPDSRASSPTYGRPGSLERPV